MLIGENMKVNRSMAVRLVLLISLMASLTVLSSRLQADTGSCGGVPLTLPFTDVQGNAFFCQIAAAYFSGLTNGTSATTYTPSQPVPREQMAAFITRTMDQSLKRGSKRAAIGKWWDAKHPNFQFVKTFSADLDPQLIACDGHAVWVAWSGSGSLSRHNSHANAPFEEQVYRWTGAPNAHGILAVGETAFIVSNEPIGKLYTTSASFNTTLLISSDVGPAPFALTTDGDFLWIANYGNFPSTGGVTRIRPDNSAKQSFTSGFTHPVGILFDGANLWVTDDELAPNGNSTLKRVDLTSGAVIQTIPMQSGAAFPVFDGTNLWVLNPYSNSVSVVRAVGGLRGTVLQTLTGNGLSKPIAAAFDGERIAITNETGASVSLFRATDLTPLGSISFPGQAPRGICSDGIYFYMTNPNGAGPKVSRF
jgi:DNA-binding beta-propeller fold protein YncE